MGRILSSSERTKLIKRHRKERDRRVCDRIKAVLAYDKGLSYAQISELFLLDGETIRRHVKDYLEKDKLAPENGGSESRLSERETLKLKAHLKEKTYLHAQDICAYVKQAFDKHYSVSGMTKWLKANGFCYKKPHAVPAKANKEKQLEFIDSYEQLKIKAEKKGEPIYFADSVHPQHQTQLAYGWILKGERKAVPTTARQPRLNIIGAICLNGHKFIHQQADKVDAESIISFLIRLRKQHPGKHYIHLILDNAGYHRDKDVRAFAEFLGIKLHYLPPYSPNLNPIERVWKLMRESVMYNTYYPHFAEFSEAVTGFLKSVGRKKSILRARITDNFQVLHSPISAS